jgi:hypothetical protein
MTLVIRDAIRRRDQMRIGTVSFRSTKRQMADIMRSASARFVERDFQVRRNECFDPTFIVSAFVIHLIYLLWESCSSCSYTGCLGAPW